MLVPSRRPESSALTPRYSLSTRVDLDLCCSPRCDELTLGEDVDLVCQGQHQPEVVLDQDDGGARISDLLEELGQPHHLVLVQP